MNAGWLQGQDRGQMAAKTSLETVVSGPELVGIGTAQFSHLLIG